MKDQLIEIYQAEIDALRNELQKTRGFIYRDYFLQKGISAEATQDLINQFNLKTK